VAPADALPSPPLTGSQRRLLRGLAQPRKAVVHVGSAGLSESVLAAVNAALLDHELIKVRLLEPDDKHGASEALAAAVGAHLCGLVGHTVILYRAHPEKPRIVLPKRGRAPRTGVAS
jgi:RNA-binding protein